jgi:hypothetical protein
MCKVCAVNDAVARFVERFASVLEESGMPRMPSRVFAALLATDSGRATAAELADGLRVSAAAVSRKRAPAGVWGPTASTPSSTARCQRARTASRR